MENNPADDALPGMLERESLFITLRYESTKLGTRNYRWALFCTGSAPPSGILLQVAAKPGRPLELYKQVLRVVEPLTSRTLVAFLKISCSPGREVLETCADWIGPMDPSNLPAGEPRWTSVLWVREMLRTLQNNGHISLPASLGSCQHAGAGKKTLGSALELTRSSQIPSKAAACKQAMQHPAPASISA